MTKKSAASMKVVKDNKDQVDPELNFGKYKEIELGILKTKRILVDRIDTHSDIRSFYHDYFGEYPEFIVVKDACDTIGDILDEMIKIVEGFTLEEFKVKEIEDPFANLLKTRLDVDNDDDAWMAQVRFNFIRPFGERVLRMHELVWEDCKAAGLVSEDAED